MALVVLKYEMELKTVECWHCQMTFGITSYFMDRRREDHQTFYCPAGHQQCYPQETTEEKLKKRFEAQQLQTRMEREQREKAEAKLRRVEKGTCPKCNRHFQNVERHMKTQHKPAKK